MSTNEIIIKTLFREVSAHVGQDDLSNAQQLLDRAAREHGHHPEVERFLDKVYRNLGLERPRSDPGFDFPDVPSAEDLDYLTLQESLHQEEEFVVAPPPSDPLPEALPARKKLQLKRNRTVGDSESTEGPKIVYRSRTTKSTFESAADATENATQAEPEVPDLDSVVATRSMEAVPTPELTASPEPTPAPDNSILSGAEQEPASPAIPESEPKIITSPESFVPKPVTSNGISPAVAEDDEEDESELSETEDWQQSELLFAEDDTDEEPADETASPISLDSSEDFSYEDLLALDEWDDAGEDEDSRADDELGLDEQLTLEQRARQVAIEFLLENDLDEGWLAFLTDVFTTRGRGAVRKAMQWAIDRDIALEQLELAQELKALWKVRQDYWTNLNHAWAKGECAEATYRLLSWRLAIRMVTAFDAIPAFEELELILEHEYESWINHSVLRRTYPVFQRYLSSYRFSASPRLLPASQGYHFTGEEWAEPEAFSLEPAHGYQLAQQMAEMGVDGVNRSPVSNYGFSDMPMDKLQERWQKPEDDKDKNAPTKESLTPRARGARKQPIVRRTPDFLLEEATS